MKDVKFWRYYIPSVNGVEGWGVFLIDSTGMFAAVTDYGNAAYMWDHHGKDDIREFFAKGLSGGFLLQKLFYDLKEYDRDETLKRVKENILQCRHERYFDRDKAREEWDLLNEHDDLYYEIDFNRWYEDTSLPDAGDHFTKGYPSPAKAFVNKLFPRFSEAVAEELKNEFELPKAIESTEQTQAV